MPASVGPRFQGGIWCDMQFCSRHTQAGFCTDRWTEFPGLHTCVPGAPSVLWGSLNHYLVLIHLQKQLLTEGKAFLLSAHKGTGLPERLWVFLLPQHPPVWTWFRGIGSDVALLRWKLPGEGSEPTEVEPLSVLFSTPLPSIVCGTRETRVGY